MPLDNSLNFYEVTQLMFGQHVGLVQLKMKMMSFSCHCKLVWFTLFLRQDTTKKNIVYSCTGQFSDFVLFAF